MFENIKYEKKDHIAYVTIDRPDAMNALNNAVLDELFTAFYNISKDDEVRVAILTGAGKAFVAGADIAAMHRMNPVEGRAMMIKGHNVMNLMESIEKPVIAAINGFALGGGCELAMACDIRIASEKAKFGQPEVGLGLIPGFGGTQRLPRIVGKSTAKKLIFTGDIIDAKTAAEIGLVEEPVAPEELMTTAEALAQKIIKNAPIAVGSAKTAINVGYDIDMKTASTVEIEAFTGPFSSEDKKEGLGAFLEKRPAKFQNK